MDPRAALPDQVQPSELRYIAALREQLARCLLRLLALAEPGDAGARHGADQGNAQLRADTRSAAAAVCAAASGAARCDAPGSLRAHERAEQGAGEGTPCERPDGCSSGAGAAVLEHARMLRALVQSALEAGADSEEARSAERGLSVLLGCEQARHGAV